MRRKSPSAKGERRRPIHGEEDTVVMRAIWNGDEPPPEEDVGHGLGFVLRLALVAALIGIGFVLSDEDRRRAIADALLALG